MADAQHLEWLDEGVEAWNARIRKKYFRADLSGADLRGAVLQRADLQGADLREANVYSAVSTNDGSTAEYTDLSLTIDLTQKQLERMNGDSGTILPEGLVHPADWKVIDLPEDHPNFVWFKDRLDKMSSERDVSGSEKPNLPAKPKGNDVDIDANARLSLGSDDEVPKRSDLSAIFEELKASVVDLRSVGSLDNLSPLLAKGLARFLDQIPDDYIDIEQVRFGVSAQTLRMRFEAEKEPLSASSPEKVGHIEAVLYVSDLIAARLPEWKEFLEEEEDDIKVFEAKKDEAQSVLEDAADALAHSPETFDASLFVRVREYLEDSSILGYLAAKELLLSIAHKTFTLALDLGKDTVSEVRKGIIKNIARALQIQLGAVLLELAGLLPKELGWLVSWLEYLPSLLK